MYLPGGLKSRVSVQLPGTASIQRLEERSCQFLLTPQSLAFYFYIALNNFLKMRNYTIAIALFCSATGSRSLPAGDNAAADGFAETLLRKLKVMPPAKCTCQDGFTLIDGTCTRSIETDPQVN